MKKRTSKKPQRQEIPQYLEPLAEAFKHAKGMTADIKGSFCRHLAKGVFRVSEHSEIVNSYGPRTKAQFTFHMLGMQAESMALMAMVLDSSDLCDVDQFIVALLDRPMDAADKAAWWENRGRRKNLAAM